LPLVNGGEPVGDLALVLHSHMPYVEGFGTFPFGEEWLFDAVLRSYVPVLDAADRLTLSVTPVLADQLEGPGVAERLRSFAREFRIASAEADAEDLGAECARACAAEAERYRRALARLEALDGRLLELFAAPAREGRVELVTSAATHAIIPLLATVAGRRLQIDAGLRSHRRRFGEPAGFWLPECAYSPGVERELAERGLGCFCVDQSAHEDPADALVPIATAAGPVAFTVDWEVVSWVWGDGGYPSASPYADLHRKSLRGIRPWAIDGGPYRPEVALATAREQAGDFTARVAARLEAHRTRTARPGLIVFAVDTELLGHWWWEGPVWLEAVLAGLEASGVRAVTLSEALERHPARQAKLERASWGEGKDLRTWDSPAVADLAWGARRLELRLLRAVASGEITEPAAERAARELLALQASDWAFLDYRGEAGDYPHQRATDHARALLDAIHSATPPDAALRNLAPDLSLAPLLEP
jgi:1,4-alpha-glucan branching enzyme